MAQRGTTRRALGSQHAAALALVGVLDGIGLHLEADDARAREGVRLVVLHDEAQVVVLVGGRVMVRLGVRVEVGAVEVGAWVEGQDAGRG